MTVVQNSLAIKLILHGLPWFLKLLCEVFVPNLHGVKFLSAQSRIGAYHAAIGLTNQLVWIIAAYLLGTMLLRLIHVDVQEVKVPKKEADALRGAAFPWKHLAWFISVRSASAKLRASRMRLLLLDKMLTCAIWCGMAVPVLNLLHIKIRTVLAVGGVGGLATGLALQNLVQNLISGILIYINGSVCEGLEVVLSGEKVSGVVASVGWFNTLVNQYDGFQVVVPNRRIVDGTVVDKTNKRFRVVSEGLLVLMEDSSAIADLVSSVQRLLHSFPTVLQEAEVANIRRKNKGYLKIYPPQFVFDGFSDYGAKFLIRAYFQAGLSGDTFLEEKSQLLVAITNEIHACGGKVGFPGLFALSGAMPTSTAGIEPEPLPAGRKSVAWWQDGLS